MLDNGSNDMVIHREAVAAWAVGPDRVPDDGSPAGPLDVEIIAVTTSAVGLDMATTVPMLDIAVPTARLDEMGRLHLTVAEALTIASTLAVAARAATDAAGRG